MYFQYYSNYCSKCCCWCMSTLTPTTSTTTSASRISVIKFQSLLLPLPLSLTQVDVSNISKPLDESGIKVNMDDFDKALSEVKPNLGLKAETLDALMQHGMVHYGERYDKMLDTLQKLAEQVWHSRASILSYMLLLIVQVNTVGYRQKCVQWFQVYFFAFCNFRMILKQFVAFNIYYYRYALYIIVQHMFNYLVVIYIYIIYVCIL